MSRTPTRATSLAVAAILATTTLGAQELKRVVVQPSTGNQQRTATRTPPKGYFHEAPPVTATNITQATDLPDVPDFVKSEDIVKDGVVVGIKKVGTPYLLDFTNGSYAPPRGIDPLLRAKLTSSINASTFGFIMFEGRMSDERMELLRKMGVKLIDAHTYQSMKAWIPASALSGLENANWIHWVGYARTHQKIDHNFVVPMAIAKDDDYLPVIINPFVSDLGKDTKWVVNGEHKVDPFTVVDGESATWKEAIPNGPFHKALVQRFGFKFENYNEIIHNFEGKMRKKDIQRLLKEDWVHTVELYEGLPTEDHDQMIPMVHQDIVRKSYDGKGVPCGYIDSGIDSTPWHNDFGGIYYVYWGNALTPTSSHGTHVAGTIWGNGNANNRYEGGAPGAGRGGATNRLFFSRNDRSLSSNAGSFGANYKDSGNNTSPYPRVISNSYSWKSSAGYYGSESNARTVDAASYSKKQLWVFSSGNKQTTANYWCGSPSSGKNVLTCGAVSDQSNAGVKPSWSRWGVRDFRTKPDVVAPGDIGTSCNWNSTNTYSNKSGTSMSTPLVSSTMITRIDASSWYTDKPEALRARAVASAKNYNTLSSGQYTAPQSGFSTRQTTGWGLINSKNMVFGSSQSTGYTWAGTFTASGQGYTSAQVTLPSDTQYVRLVCVMTEPAASSGATKARRNDVRAYLDYYPYSAGNNTGNYTALSSLQTVIVYNSIYMANKDKRVKIKCYAQSIVASQARWSVVMYVYRKNPFSVKPNVGITGPSVMKPNTSADFTTYLQSPSTSGQFHSGRLSLYDSSFTMNSMRRTTEANYTQYYYPSNTHPSYPHPRVTSGSSYGMTVGSGTYRNLIWNLKAPTTSGNYTMTAYGRYHSSSTGISLKTASKTVCVDGLAPNAISGLTSTRSIRTWYNSTSITHSWKKASDNGCAGVSLLRYVASTTGLKSPTSTSSALSSLTTARTNTFAHGTANYFSIRVYDRAGNLSGYVYRGPYYIDTIRPVISSVLINSGATRTSSSTVSVRVTASDSGSGAYQMRYSGNNSTWSSWTTYTSSSRTVALGSLGWTTEGTKACYVQVRDRAGNISTTRFDTISWIRPPNITGATISTQPNVTRGFYRLTGTDFIGTNLVTFGGVALAPYTSANDDWWNGGAYRIISDNVMYVYPPQGRTPGSYQVRCRNAYYYGTPRNVTVTFQNGRILYTNSASTAGRPFTMHMARSSSEPSTTLGLIIVSPVKSPSNAPGIVSLEIGLNFSAYLEVVRAPFNNSTRSLKLTVPTLASYKGLTAWFEGVYLRNPLPLPTTNAWSVKLR